ncbi:AT-hook motif nuclear-localized protein 20 [Camellia lanceoleosa]|uniref:AT-hook motif nuclear-localized protein 20 n=1 Tax=Camellia lanceoleosa TaxID=1840588 RepID=A0ACC0GXV0_9ERIC|nr:AT-hook motif nuclear-localized protein 20 [Camellia lanceoleosa]
MVEYSGPSSLPQVQSLTQTSEEGEEEQSHQNGPHFIRSIKPGLTLNDDPTAMAEGANQRPHGHPPSSKNKPKLAVTQTTRDGDASMKAAVLEITARSDVIDTVVQFERRRQLGGVTIMSASGLPGADLVVHDGGDDHGNPKLGGAGHGGAGGNKRCSNMSMSISSHGISSPAPLNSLAPSDVVT